MNNGRHILIQVYEKSPASEIAANRTDPVRTINTKKIEKLRCLEMKIAASQLQLFSFLDYIGFQSTMVTPLQRW